MQTIRYYKVNTACHLVSGISIHGRLITPTLSVQKIVMHCMLGV